MATDQVLQKMMLHLVTIISTAYEFDKGLIPTPKGPMYLAFMQQGFSLDYFNGLIEIGEKMNYWKSTNETITLTDVGIEKAKRLSTIEKAHNS
jgi:hypothetical protein